MDNLDYLNILKALESIPFHIGRNYLIDFLKGELTESITKNGLDYKPTFGSLLYERQEINSLIDILLRKKMLQYIPYKKYKLLGLTEKGKKEQYSPTIKQENNEFTIAKVTNTDKKMFEKFGSFLKGHSDEQKKAIISTNKEILCVAGAGTGKTTVLTKRIDYLVKLKSVNPNEILAITFTRKARFTMVQKLAKLGINNVKVETFNSFSEKILLQHNDLIYKTKVRVITYSDKTKIINKALRIINKDMQKAIDIYFTFSQKASKTPEQLAHIFMNDCFYIVDHYKAQSKEVENFTNEASDKKSAELVYTVCKYIEAAMKKYGLRDYTDQIIDTITFFKKHNSLIPKFNYILIDEYQDINSAQIEIINLLHAENIFCVGDPRQSIFGWRGSDINYLLNFQKKYPNSQIVSLTENFRSENHIVELINKAIKEMNLPNLTSNYKADKQIYLKNFYSEEKEHEFIIKEIQKSNLPKNEIFVLARTNRQLNELSEKLKAQGIKYCIKSDELRTTKIAEDNEIILATIHAIKGLEAEQVFVIGANTNNFPCKAIEHPVMELVKIKEYDKEEEEKRLFYVAMSRAKSILYLTHQGTQTYFINYEMEDIINGSEKANISEDRKKLIEMFVKKDG